jgi:hypothetical protein
MDDPRWEPGMPVLDRQAIGAAAPAAGAVGPATGAPSTPPRSVPEVEPTPLQRQYINLSAIGLVCGVVAISALELGARLDDPIVRIPVLVGAPILLLTTADAILRIWRSALAWLPVNRGRGLFRLAWVAAALVGWAAIAGATWLVLSA